MDLRKVYGGTPVGQDSKCDSCVYARIIRGYSESEKLTFCDRIFEPVRIPFRVRDCSDYLDKRLPCVEDLEDIAWVLRSKSAGKRAGFIGITQPEEPSEVDGAQMNRKTCQLPILNRRRRKYRQHG